MHSSVTVYYGLYTRRITTDNPKDIRRAFHRLLRRSEGPVESVRVLRFCGQPTLEDIIYEFRPFRIEDSVRFRRYHRDVMIKCNIVPLQEFSEFLRKGIPADLESIDESPILWRYTYGK